MGLLDSLSSEQVMQCQTEEDCDHVTRLLPPTEAALLDWAVNLMADVAQEEQQNKMNAHNVATVFAPNMTKVFSASVSSMFILFSNIPRLFTVSLRVLMPEKPTLIESLSSWSQIMSKKPVDNARFTEILGELRFQEKPAPPPASIHQTVPPPVAVDRALSFDLSDLCQQKCGGHSSFQALLGLPNNQYVCSASARCHDGFPPKNSDKLQLCTERLGSESSDDVDDLIEEDVDEWSSDQWKEKMDAERQALANGGMSGNCSDVRTRTGGFPPPVYSIGKSGRPWIYYRSYRKNGRFVLTEIRIPTQEFLRASRQDGRLRLQLVHPDEDIAEGDEGAGGENEEEVDEEDEKTELSQGNDH
ncbi:hypothetical protein BHM03_00042950 [Ensete ventricosum]|nr:hypothetical protein BHM03_00042950 [Ensete ventricosum]